MVLEYLQGTSFFNDSPQHHDGQQYDGSNIKRRLSKSSHKQQSVLSPVARILKTSADAVNNAVLHIRDGLTEEQRTAQRKLEERKQIFHLRLKNV
jgi:hypothetical protein